MVGTTKNYQKLSKSPNAAVLRMVETAPWEQKPDVIALESLQKVVPEALTEKAAKRTVGKNQIRRKCAYNR